MTTRGENPPLSRTASLRHSLRRRLKGPERDPKKVGILGAPQCRCTPLVLALCVGLTGLVTVGVGSCMAAFMWHDETPKALGLSLVGLGIAMMIAGAGLCIYDSYVRSLMPPRENAAVAYTSQQQGSTHIPPSTLTAAPVGHGQAAGTIMNVQTMPSSSNHGRRPQIHQDTAPPPYDAVLQEDVSNRSSHGSVVHHQQISSTNQGRGSYHSAVRETRTTIDSVV